MGLGIFDLVGVIMLVLAGTSLVYLLGIKNKTRSTQMLLWFFLCVVLSSIATLVTNVGAVWDWAFAPSQDALLILGGVFLARFAYLYPSSDQSREARWATTFFAALALVALTYAVSFAIRYIANLPGDLQENQIYYFLTPVATSLLVFVFFRRSIHWSAQTQQSKETKNRSNKLPVRFLFKPNNRSAVTLRNYGLSLAISLIPVLALIEQVALPAVLASFIFNFGSVIAISALMLTYLNFAPEPVTISAKLVGISLVSVLLILGLAGVWVFHTNPGIDEHSLVATFIILVFISSLLIMLVFPKFFRTALLDPLEKLSRGVKVANEGDLNIQVAVQYEDEIGFLTQSFNRMISSLNEATQALKNESAILERQVVERTAELDELNQQLTSENIERKETQAMLQQQLLYQKSLAGCSQSLLVAAKDEINQQDVLNQALEHLRSGAQAGRAYIFHMFDDSELGLCIGMLAEVCAPGIPPHINNPVNRKFPLSRLPSDLLRVLLEGYPYGGPVKEVFASTPNLKEAFLSQRPPLLSVMLFPLFDRDRLWGFVGFDDCITERYWDVQEISMLRTASEMIRNTLQRWDIETQLRDTLDELEVRVQERTAELSQSNIKLSEEIKHRQRFQEELEERLEIEKTLAKISTRLLSSMELTSAIQETMEDVGLIVQADRVAFIQLFDDPTPSSKEMIEWHSPDVLPIPDNLERYPNTSYSWFRHQLDSNQLIYISDLSALPDSAVAEKKLIGETEIDSLLLIPIFMEEYLAGVIACGNPNLPKPKILENTQSLEVVAGMLSSLLQRESLLNSLEQKIADRTRELSAFFDLAVLAGEAHELSDIMQPALTKVMEISASEAAMIHVFDEEQRAMRIVAQRGFQSNYLLQLQTIRLDETTMAWITDRSNDVWSSSTSKHPDAFELAQFQSDTHIPLHARGKIQGLLSCYRRAQTPFNPYQVFFLNAIGEQLGLAVENYRLRLKTEELATIQERQRLARELHDAVSQSLYSLTLFARSGRDAVENGDQAKLLDSLEQLETNSLAALKEMRLLLYQLRSLALEKGGLLQAIESRFNLVERRSGNQASVTMDESILLPDRVEQELFLLITEALNNALKHANASQVTVNIQAENEHLVLVVWNNGSSFDPTQALGGMGLENMRERATALGGKFVISSQPGSGTSIRVEIPCLETPARERQNEC